MSNDINFNKVKFNLLEGKRLSGDSIYIEIDLPKDNAFFDGRFRYQITVLGKIDLLESTSPVLIVPKNKILENGNLFYHLGLTIQDLYPLNCRLNGSCYQRIYFNIFENYKLNTKSNYFTVRLTDFDNCYVERADVDNQLVFTAKNKIHWQGIDFLKVK